MTGYNTHQDNGTVSIVPVPGEDRLEAMTRQVYENNHWDLKQNIKSAGGGRHEEEPVAVPAKIAAVMLRRAEAWRSDVNFGLDDNRLQQVDFRGVARLQA